MHLAFANNLSMDVVPSVSPHICVQPGRRQPSAGSRTVCQQRRHDRATLTLRLPARLAWLGRRAARSDAEEDVVAVQQQRVALRLQRQQHVAQRAPRAQRARAARQLRGHASNQRVHLRGSPARAVGGSCRKPGYRMHARSLYVAWLLSAPTQPAQGSQALMAGALGCWPTRRVGQHVWHTARPRQPGAHGGEGAQSAASPGACRGHCAAGAQAWGRVGPHCMLHACKGCSSQALRQLNAQGLHTVNMLLWQFSGLKRKSASPFCARSIPVTGAGGSGASAGLGPPPPRARRAAT